MSNSEDLDYVLNSYDWGEAFGFADSFSMDDVEEVIAYEDGENDGADWFGIFKLKDGRFAYLSAWCDYTGWDCRSGGHSAICDKLDDLLIGHVGIEQCNALGIKLSV